MPSSHSASSLRTVIETDGAAKRPPISGSARDHYLCRYVSKAITALSKGRSTQASTEASETIQEENVMNEAANEIRVKRLAERVEKLENQLWKLQDKHAQLARATGCRYRNAYHVEGRYVKREQKDNVES